MELRQPSIRRLQHLAMCRHGDASCRYDDAFGRIATHAQQHQANYPPAHRLEWKPEGLRKGVYTDRPPALVWRRRRVGCIGGLQSGVPHQRLDIGLCDCGHNQGVDEAQRLTTHPDLVQQEGRGDAQYDLRVHRHVPPCRARYGPRAAEVGCGPDAARMSMRVGGRTPELQSGVDMVSCITVFFALDLISFGQGAAPVAGRHIRWKPPSKAGGRRSRSVALGDGRARTRVRASRGSTRDHEPRRPIGEGERRQYRDRMRHRADPPPPGRWRASPVCPLVSERPRRRQFRLSRAGVAATSCRQAAR